MLLRTKKLRKILLPLLLLVVVSSFFVGTIVLAQTLQTGVQYGTATGLGTQDLRVSVMRIVRAVLGFLGVLALLIIFYGGWVWMTAAGNADRIDQAKRILINAVIGLAIIFSAFMITSFIINQLAGATGGGGNGGTCNPGDPPPTSCSSCVAGKWTFNPGLPGCIPPANQCLVINITPSGVKKPINSVARVRFNLPITAGANTIQVYNMTAGGVLVPTTQTVSGNTVELVPTATCPTDATRNCFAPDSTFEIRSNDSSIECGNLPLSCTLGGNCVRTFSTGNALDVAPPTIAIINNQVCQDPATQLQAFVNDDYGIAYVDFFQTFGPNPQALVGSDGYVSAPPAEIASVPWDTSGYAVGDDVVIDATAVDYDSNSVPATAVTIPIRAGHCCNLVQDTNEGETGVDCGGNDCEACTPVIEWVDPLDGAPGSLITIHGRRFDVAPGTVTFLGGNLSSVLPAACSAVAAWSDQQIIAGVPNLTPAQDGAIQVTRADGQSDRTDQAPGTTLPDFDANTNVRPGLCSIVPLTGPVASPLLLNGVNFTNPVDVYFGGLPADGNPNAATSNLISLARVPLLGNGDVQVRSVNVDSVNPVNSEFSNPVTFKVDSTIVSPPTFECSSSLFACSPTDPNDALCDQNFHCTAACICEPDTPPSAPSCDSDTSTPTCQPDLGLCSGGYVCDPATCACQPNVAAGTRSTYAWFFTTTSLGPRVAETCTRSGSCDASSISSPTPFSRTGTDASRAKVGNRPDDGAVPIDAIVGATFTEDMQTGSLSASTITVSACGNASAPFNANTCGAIAGAITATPINFEFIPNGALTVDTWYRVTLNAAQIFGANGVSLSPNDLNGNYSWVFKTRTVSTPGEVGCVAIQPAVQTSYFINALSDDWNGQAFDKDFACVVLNPQTACSVGWNWSTSGSQVAIESAVVNNAITRALAETVPGPGVPVIAECVTPVGSISGTAIHNVDFSSPVVIGKFPPPCGSACLNSKIGATFSLPMDDISVANALSLHICFDNPTCAPTPQNRVLFNTWTPNDPGEAANSYTGTLAGGDVDGNGTLDYWLLPNTYYRVVVRDTARSAIENKPLANLNYDTDGILGNDAFSWVFKTKPSYGICLPHEINVVPASALATVGDSLLYAGVAKTSPEQCFGQSLDPYSFDWAWNSTVPSVANFRGFPTLRDACGNGVIEQGEDCDDGNLVAGDGCDAACLTEGDLDSGNSTYNQDVCGNGIIEPTEQCEYPGSRGCANNCTLSGSVPPILSRCGDGVIGLGEQCDDANLLLGGLAKDGDGCSSSCLVEDPNRWFCRSNSTLRFNFKKPDCSFGTCGDGYTCVQLSSAPGNTNIGPVCGNGIIESKEECDYGTEPNGDGSDGCSDECIHQGSVQEANDPPTVGPFQIVEALGIGGIATDIQAWIASFVPPTGPLGSGHLEVGDGTLGQGDPRVTERYPDCGTACNNAGIGAVFNVAVQALNGTNITLYECGTDSQCVIAGRSSIPVTIAPYSVNVVSPEVDAININLPLSYNPTDVAGNGVVIPTLLPNTYYRVVVSNRVQNLLGRNLVGLNFDDPNDPAIGPDSHSWVFRTQVSSAACTIGRVEVHPEKITLPGGVLQTYFAEPWTLGGSCDPLFGSKRGQRLNAYFYDWRWDTFEKVAGDNAADMVLPPRDGCGNTVVEFGEDCDDGNLDSGDGCSGTGSPLGLCQHEGSAPPAPTCIDGVPCCSNTVIEQGEDCDDGNTVNGDGCSNVCLHEGNARYGLAVCGNGKVETGEQCDTGSEPNGTNTDGCTDICTFSGAVTGTNSICGDGQVTLGENCDTGELSSNAPILSNDGCTGTIPPDFSGRTCSGLSQSTCQNAANAQWCTWTGAACQTRACLNETTAATGNTNWKVAVCGNGVVELGEECDLGTEPDGITTDGCNDRCLFAGSVYDDNRLDPYQIVQTLAITSTVTEVNEEIRAWHNFADNIVGVGELKVVSGGLIDFAVIGHRPPVGDPNLQCLNVQLAATFSRPLDQNTLNDNFRLCEGAACDITSPNLVAELAYSTTTGSCVNNACRFPRVDAANLDFGFCSNNSDCIGSQVRIKKVNTPSGFLDRTKTYKIIINPANLLDTSGDALSTSCLAAGTECNWSFQTSDSFCSCDFVGVNIANTSGGTDTVLDTFTCATNTCGQSTIFEPRDDDADLNTNGNQHIYETTCYDVNNPTGSRIALNPLGHTFSYVQFDPVDTLQDFSGIPSFDPTEVVTANPKNGKADVRVTAVEYICSGTGQLCDPDAPVCPVGSTCRGKLAASQTVTITNFICNNPWPDLSSFPYRDNEDNSIPPDTNFHLFYCRDSGKADTTNDDLPALSPGLITAGGGASIKDFLFPVGTNGDGIGIKVLKNPLHLSPSTWYRSGLCNGQADFDNLCFNNADCEVGETCQLNIFSQGNFNELTVDGYEAIRGGRTVYVGAPNLDAPSLYSNMYLISYNQNAAPSTVEIFNRILDPKQSRGAWTFNNPPEFSNHRICQNVGYYSGTDIACKHVGMVSATYCSTLGSQVNCSANSNLGCIWDAGTASCLGNDCSVNKNQSVCEADAVRGCTWSSALNDCLSLVCEPITCSNDFECPNLSCNADKEMLVRDAKRYGDLLDIQILLRNYFNQTGLYPSLRAGSYIASTTFSVWPSWQQTFARDLGTSLTVDPINRFVGCPGFTCDANGNGDLEVGEDTYCNAAVDTVSCPPPGKCVPVDADQAKTCWDEVNLQFSCPADSLVYAYRAAAGGTEYQLFSRFEYEGTANWLTAASYNLPLSNLAGPQCDSLNVEVHAASIAGGVVPPAFADFYCYSGRPDDGTITCTPATIATDCPGFAAVPTTKCSPDVDADGVPDFGSSDNCAPSQDCFDFPTYKDCWNPDQRDAPDPITGLPNGVGDACDPTCHDVDKDNVCDQIDNCPTVWNPGQQNVDNDAYGDVCDLCTDIDGDGFCCPASGGCGINQGILDCADNPATEPLAATIYPKPHAEDCTTAVDDNCDGLTNDEDIVACPVNTCSDTDAGQTDYVTKGTVTGTNSGSSFANSDYCKNNTDLQEYYCNGTTLAFTGINCTIIPGADATWRCVSGECVPPLPQPDSCFDSDGGANAQTVGTVSGFENNGQSYSNTDSCAVGVLTEWTCSTFNKKVSTPTPCSSVGPGWICGPGVCVPPPPPPDSCADSDGNNIATTGSTTGFSGGTAYTNTDSCQGVQVREYTCSGTTSVSTVVPCTGVDTCQSGRCIPQPNSCIDSDGADDNYITTGATSGYSGGVAYNNQDNCGTGVNANVLTEYGCSGTNQVSGTKDCTTLGSGYTCQVNRCVPPADSCIDTDGNDRQNAGSVSGFSGGSSYSFNDTCPTPGTPALTEWTCSGSNAISTNVNCATQFGAGYVCNAGRCILANETGLCFDGIDNDGDGPKDCLDPDCAGSANGTTGTAQVCCNTNADCSTWVNSTIANNCASVPTCNAGTKTCSFTASDTLCGTGNNACGVCSSTTLQCGRNNSVCTGNCTQAPNGCAMVTPNNYQCQGDNNRCTQLCSTCTDNGLRDFTCTDVNNAQDCNGPGASQCCQVGFLCNSNTPPQCISCTDSDKDGFCDNTDVCPYDPDNNSDGDSWCAVGCTDNGSHTNSGPYLNGYLCDGTPSPSVVVYDTCQGGNAQVNSGVCTGSPLRCSNSGNPCSTHADCTNFSTGSCTAANSCLVLFGADERLNVYINGRMVAGNLYLPAGFVENGELLGGNGNSGISSNSYPNITKKVFFNIRIPGATQWFVNSGQAVVSFEALSNTWNKRQIRGAFVNSIETDFCGTPLPGMPAFNYTPKFTKNVSPALPLSCYTDDNTQNTGIPPASNWKNVGYTLGAGWAPTVLGAPTAGPVSNLFSTGPSWLVNNPVAIWSKTYGPAFTYSHAYCRSAEFIQP